MNQALKLSIAAALAAAGIGVRFAASSAENDAQAINDAKISLTQAIAAAEKHAAGKASKAEIERHKDKLVYEVEVVSGTKVMDVKVDPQLGTVLSATEDTGDHERHRHHHEKQQ